MIEYLDKAVVAAMWQIIGCFGMLFAFALLMDWIGRRLRASGKSVFGKIYSYVIMPGTLCREGGHALACLITGTRLKRHMFSGFGDREIDGTHATMDAGTPLSAFKALLITTGPIWFGACVMGLVAVLASGSGLLPDTSSLFVDGPPGICAYVTSLVAASVGMLGSMVFVWHWTSPFCLICLYLFFCVAAGMSISGKELRSIWKGMLIFAVMLFVLNLVPGVDAGMKMLWQGVAPYVFVMHAVLLFAFLLNVIFYLLLLGLCRLFGVKRRGKADRQ